MARLKTKRPKKVVEIPASFIPLFWKALDKRCNVVREFHLRYKKLKADVGADSIQLDMLCQRAAFISIQLETMECRAAERGRLNEGVYTQMSNALSGLLSKLGLKRKDPDKLTLKSYLNDRKARRA